MSTAPRAVLEAAAAAARDGDDATLALVLETEGSTYVRAGAAALFGRAPDPVGWLSGGCLEPEIARHAADAAQHGRIGWLELDTRDDDDLLDGSAPGCRGRLRLALLPLRQLPGWDALVAHWLAHPLALMLALDPDGALCAQVGDVAHAWRLPGPPCPWRDGHARWDVPFAPMSRVVVFGAGPETALLLPALRTLGWKTVLVERRARWHASAALADVALAQAPAQALAHVDVQAARAALVMHHHFEFDRDALEALAATPIAFIGLLGPRRRRDDLFRLLPAAARASLEPRLHAPVGLDLGGQGAEAIALSITAQLQAYRHGV